MSFESFKFLIFNNKFLLSADHADYGGINSGKSLGPAFTSLMRDQKPQSQQNRRVSIIKHC